jgi:hypothetical protein
MYLLVLLNGECLFVLLSHQFLLLLASQLGVLIQCESVQSLRVSRGWEVGANGTEMNTERIIMMDEPICWVRRSHTR